ncbi:hypothetical protein Poli38472_006605 [Pythium oligandrum]|uniref:CG-1 domain-containing protein n=1 Tax=Pythium oligandrum TaxID=41045 RepID=A0A8K1FAU8_PYTOL|nr:hypothetical protein Poli38472_006605 [Pythium oligandrum]|eukprot:TMW56595.1 hypothetical protein Poli38472_006605 [Pythium oligandrum]
MTLAGLRLSSPEAAQRRAAELRVAATRRWLVKDELVFLLLHYKLTAIPKTRSLQLRPASGTLLLYDVNDVPDYKKDGWQWQKRKDNSGRVREDRAKLVINREVIILGTYVHSSEIPTFHRRNYHLRDSNPNIMLVHYFDEVHKMDPGMGAFLASSLGSKAISRSDNGLGVAKGLKRALPSPASDIRDRQDTQLLPPARQPSPRKLDTWDPSQSVDAMMTDCLAMDFISNGYGLPVGAEGPSAETEFETMKSDEFQSIPSFDDEALLSELSSAFMPTEANRGLIDISDYSPDWDFITGGAKILICLAAPIADTVVLGEGQLYVQFGPNKRALAERISDTVVRCSAPQAMTAGTLEMFVCHCLSPDSAHCVQLSTKQKFQYRSALSTQDAASRPVEESMNSTAYSIGFKGKRGRSPSSHTRRAFMAMDSRALSSVVDTDFNERQCKIRVVERLSEFHEAIRTTSGNFDGSKREFDESIPALFQQSPSSSGKLQSTLQDLVHSEPDAEAATLGLDDGAIEELSDQDLESLSEKLFERVVRQLVTVAHTSEELLEELNSLDETGLSLLHYVSFYNYSHLIPLLLSHGAQVNQQSTQGYTPLHLAAGCGHLQVVECLIQAGADVMATDFDDFTPAERAEKSGQHQVAAYLRRVMKIDENELTHVQEPYSSPVDMCMEIDDECTPTSEVDDTTLLAFSDSSSLDASPLRSGSYVGENQEHNRKLLLGAFSTMSLHDKCALSLSISRDLSTSNASRRRESNVGDDTTSTIVALATGSRGSSASSPIKGTEFVGSAVTSSTTEIESIGDSDVKSVIADDEENLNKLEAAMELMGPEEIQSLEEEARVIQHNVRAWLLRRNCRNMRETTKRLREAARTIEVQQKQQEEVKQATERELMSQQELSERERAAVTVQAAARSMLARKNFLQTRNVTIKVQAATRGVLCRKNFARMKTHALASLVIQRNVREWLSKQPTGADRSGSDLNTSPLLQSSLVSSPVSVPDLVKALDVIDENTICGQDEDSKEDEDAVRTLLFSPTT